MSTTVTRSTAEIFATAPPRPQKHHTKSGGTRTAWDRWLAKNIDELTAARRLEPPCVRTDGTNRWEAQCPECGVWSPVVCDKRTALQAVGACGHGATS